MISKYLHIVAVMGFVAAHGVSAAAAMRLRVERNAGRIRALLDLSRSIRPASHTFLLLIILTGVASTFEGNFWRAGWVWTSIGALAVMVVAAIALAVPYYARIRRLVADLPNGNAVPTDLTAVLRSPRPLLILAIETSGLLAILWLMVAKPF